MRPRLARILVLVSTLGLLLTPAMAAPALAQGSRDCTLTVTPRNGGPGTEFAFSGSGYSPTRIVLRRKGGPTKTVQIPPTDETSFTVRLVAGQGDTGSWKATAIDTEVCSATTSFTVGLPPTATADPGQDTRGLALAAFAGLGALFVASSVLLRPRMTRSARNR